MRSEAEAPFTSSKLAQVPRGVWALGFVSMLMDVSSEMIHALLPVYLVTVLGASTLTVGLHRGHRRGDRLDHQGLLRRAVRLARQAQAARGPRLWPGRVHQADLPAGRHGRLAGRGALHRPRRQGHPRRAARRAGRRHRAAGPARRELRPAPVARHRRRLSRAAARDRADGADGRQFPARVLGRGHPGLRLSFGLMRVRRSRNPARPTKRRADAPLRSRTRRASAARLTGGSWPSPPCSRSRASARRFCAARAAMSACRSRWSPVVLVVMNVVYALAAYPAGVLSDRVGRGRLLAARPGLPGRRRPRARRSAPGSAAVLGVASLGAAHGLHAGAGGHPGGRRRPGRTARHRFRRVQPRERNRDARGERDRRGVMGLRPGGHLLAGAALAAVALDWPSGHISAAKFVIFPHARSPLLRFKRARRKSDASRMKSRLTHARPSNRFPKRS